MAAGEPMEAVLEEIGLQTTTTSDDAPVTPEARETAPPMATMPGGKLVH